MGVSVPTIKNYLDILEGTFVVRRLPPFHTNTKKRLVKSPKIYLRDSGLVHCLLGIESFNELMGHPALGNSFEVFVIESVIAKYPRYEASFYRSSSGAEIDLVLEKGRDKIAIEIKSSSRTHANPGLLRGFKSYSSLAGLCNCAGGSAVSRQRRGVGAQFRLVSTDRLAADNFTWRRCTTDNI